MSVTYYTVITGNYDNLRPPACPSAGARFICFTDRPRNPVNGWEIQAFPQMFSDPAKQARIPKCLPHLLLPEDTQVSIYMDGAFKPQATVQTVMALLGAADLAMFGHPANHRSMHDELKFYQQLHGFVPDHVQAHVDDYVRQGLQPDGRWWAGGLVIRRHNARTANFNELWFREYLGGSANDQFALWGAVVKSDVSVNTIDGIVTMDGRFGYCLHASSGCGDNPRFEPENQFWQVRMNRIRELCQV